MRLILPHMSNLLDNWYVRPYGADIEHISPSVNIHFRLIIEITHARNFSRWFIFVIGTRKIPENLKLMYVYSYGHFWCWSLKISYIIVVIYVHSTISRAITTIRQSGYFIQMYIACLFFMLQVHFDSVTKYLVYSVYLLNPVCSMDIQLIYTQTCS